MNKISAYEIDKKLSLDSILDSIRKTQINHSIFKFLKDKVTLESEHLIVHGKVQDYLINFETNSVSIAKNNRNVCIHMMYNPDYRDPDYSEKELCILGKTLYCLNDADLFPSDGILSGYLKS